MGPIPKLNLSALGIISSTVPDSDNKVFIGGLPYNLTEDQVSNSTPPVNIYMIVSISSAVSSINFRVDTHVCELRDTPAAYFHGGIMLLSEYMYECYDGCCQGEE